MDVISGYIVMPEITLAVVGFVLLIFGAFCGDRVLKAVDGFAIGGLLLVLGTLFCPARLAHLVGSATSNYAFDNMMIDNSFTTFVKALILLSGAFSILLSMHYNEKEKLERFEFSILVLFATLGMMIMVAASDLFSLYLGLELQSLPLYVLAAIHRGNLKSSEAGLKYFVLGALSSGILLYGISLLYGYAGTTEFVALAFRLDDIHPIPLGIIIGVVFICAGLAFKISAVPFHMWTPDVYEGAPTPVTAFFSAGPKIAALALFLRVLQMPFHALTHQWTQILIFLAVASMLLGSLAGLRQHNIKRVMAYSSIANVGYALVAILAMNKGGVQALLIYLTVYFMNVLGAFGVILAMRRHGKAVETIEDLSGLGKNDPLLALSMTIFMFSMAGVPPFAGFFGKYFVFLAAVNAEMVPLAILGVLTSVVAAFYYIRIIKLMYFDDAKEPLDPLTSWGVKAVVTLGALFMVIFTIWPSPLIMGAKAAAHAIVGG